jgi:hypothetical protein
MGVLKTILYNIVVFFLLANVFYWSIPLVSFLASLREETQPTGRAVYKSFIGWRTDAFDWPDRGSSVGGRYLQRRTVNGGASGATAYFFGGSSMWGVGADDAGTIPSQFAAITGMQAENFGELGWTAHQSLVYLMQILEDGRRPDIVVFYDGANEVAVKCRVENGVASHGREKEFAPLVRGLDRPESFAHYLQPVLRLAARLNQAIDRGARSSPYDCDTDPAKAAAVAASLIADWDMAKRIVASYGLTFVGVLQPVAYLSRTRFLPPELPDDLGRQFAAVYPLIRGKMAGDPALHDLVSVLDDTDQRVYADFCHVWPNGNRRVADRIAAIIASHANARLQ